MNRSSAAKSVGKIDQLLDELANLATSPDVSTKQFCSRSVQVTESLLDLQWAAVISYAGDAEGTKAPILVAGHDVAVEQLGKLNQPFPRIASQSSQTSWLETLKRLPHIGFAPISFRNQTWGWLIAAKQNATPIKGFETEVLAGIGEIATEHLKTKSQQRDQEQIQYQNRLDAFKLNAHASLAVQRSSKQITNDVRWLCGCERATLVSLSGSRRQAKVLSVSSIATVDRNSDFTKHLQAMVSMAAKNESLLSSDAIAGQTENTKLQSLVTQWIQASGFSFLFGIPLVDRIDNKTIGYLVLESDAEFDRAGFATTLRQVQPHVAVALANATRFESLPFRRSLSMLRRFVRVNNFIKLAAAAAAITAVVVALFTLQRPFSVRATGELLPQVEQTVSAQVDGNMATVEAGDVDKASHQNNIDNAIGAVFSGDDAFKVIVEWVEKNSNWEETQLIVTADHGHLFFMDDVNAFNGKLKPIPEAEFKVLRAKLQAAKEVERKKAEAAKKAKQEAAAKKAKRKAEQENAARKKAATS